MTPACDVHDISTSSVSAYSLDGSAVQVGTYTAAKVFLFVVLCIIASCPAPICVTGFIGRPVECVAAMCRTVWLMLACAMTAGVCTCTALAAVPAGLMTATLGEP